MKEQMSDPTEPLAAEDALIKARDTFREYERIHLAKITRGSDEKALANAAMADMCNAAISALRQQAATRDNDPVTTLYKKTCNGYMRCCNEYYDAADVEAALATRDTLLRDCILALRAYRDDAECTARDSYREWDPGRGEWLWDDRVWRESDPDDFALYSAMATLVERYEKMGGEG